MLQHLLLSSFNALLWYFKQHSFSLYHQNFWIGHRPLQPQYLRPPADR